VRRASALVGRGGSAVARRAAHVARHSVLRFPIGGRRGVGATGGPQPAACGTRRGATPMVRVEARSAAWCRRGERLAHGVRHCVLAILCKGGWIPSRAGCRVVLRLVAAEFAQAGQPCGELVTQWGQVGRGGRRRPGESRVGGGVGSPRGKWPRAKRCCHVAWHCVGRLAFGVGWHWPCGWRAWWLGRGRWPGARGLGRRPRRGRPGARRRGRSVWLRVFRGGQRRGWMRA
jgi:hypothetical protein